MLDRASKAFFHTLAGSQLLKRLASRYGMTGPSGFARRFIAGETVDEAIAVERDLQARGLALTLDVLGESVSTIEAAAEATRQYLRAMDAVVAAGITRNVSVKLTQLGLDLDRDAALANLRQLVEAGRRGEFFIRIDMESAAHTQATLEIFETIWQEGTRHVGVVLQSALRRSPADLARMNALGARVRLVKGAYKEPREVAYTHKAEVDAAYLQMMRTLLVEGTFPAIATHDVQMIDATRAWARQHGIGADRFEFQMLYGIRRDLQASLVAAGYRVRVYVPFGREWFPYFMRRLGERPANVFFVLRSLVRER